MDPADVDGWYEFGSDNIGHPILHLCANACGRKARYEDPTRMLGANIEVELVCGRPASCAMLAEVRPLLPRRWRRAIGWH
jgi:hypothetical protein